MQLSKYVNSQALLNGAANAPDGEPDESTLWSSVRSPRSPPHQLWTGRPVVRAPPAEAWPPDAP